jgi:hypothetical protein
MSPAYVNHKNFLSHSPPTGCPGQTTASSCYDVDFEPARKPMSKDTKKNS